MNGAVPMTTRASDAALGRRLEYFTIGWNVLEAVVAIGAGLAASSIALVGFGADSVIESLSGAVLLWRLQTHQNDEGHERRALRIVGISFILLAGYVGFDAGKTLLERAYPSVSVPGIVLAILSLGVMPILARAKQRVAIRLGSRALSADSRQTSLCAYLSAILVGGLVLNAFFGWWWADPVAALAMVPIIAHQLLRLQSRRELVAGDRPQHDLVCDQERIWAFPLTSAPAPRAPHSR